MKLWIEYGLGRSTGRNNKEGLWMTTYTLGEKEWQSGWRVNGQLTLQEAFNLCGNIIDGIDMTKHGSPHVEFFNGEKGGVGFQVYQILVESWLIISTWPAHGFFRLNLSSCKFFNHGRVSALLVAMFGAENLEIQWQVPL